MHFNLCFVGRCFSTYNTCKNTQTGPSPTEGFKLVLNATGGKYGVLKLELSDERKSTLFISAKKNFQSFFKLISLNKI
ncbi:hypothetical protein [Methanosarcina barkeri]|uniref:hypothetical protein n=1 Tax=Methanosarcina barkeri TaxID=2208 RepID=UPI00064F7454|nr:hypothetical protein [Methanosarcina barkeri]